MVRILAGMGIAKPRLEQFTEMVKEMRLLGSHALLGNGDRGPSTVTAAHKKDALVVQMMARVATVCLASHDVSATSDVDVDTAAGLTIRARFCNLIIVIARFAVGSIDESISTIRCDTSDLHAALVAHITSLLTVRTCLSNLVSVITVLVIALVNDAVPTKRRLPIDERAGCIADRTRLLPIPTAFGDLIAIVTVLSIGLVYKTISTE